MRSAIHPYRQDAVMDHGEYAPLLSIQGCPSARCHAGTFDLADLASWHLDFSGCKE